MKNIWLSIVLVSAFSFNSHFSCFAQNPQTIPENTTEAQMTAQENNSKELAAWMIEAAQVAKDYVDTVDRAAYNETWSKGSSIFQGMISQSEWAAALQLGRAPLGKVTSRTLKDQRPAWDPKGLPGGAYMVVEYDTSFEKAPNSGELLTLRREADGKWKVLTYKVN